MLKQNFSKILESEMDRKDFLKTLGIAAAAFTGATAAIKTITSHPTLLAGVQNKTTQQTAGSFGYGTSAYGGAKVVKATSSYSS